MASAAIAVKTATGPTILLHSGNYFDLLDPSASSFTVGDIAHGLSNTCRFAGQCRAFYSVAQHSVLASQIVLPEHALAALLHDASEAFIGDVTRPLKMLLGNAYKSIEQKIEQAIFDKFGVETPLPAAIKEADLVLLATEQRDLMPAHDDTWSIIAGVQPLTSAIVPLQPAAARARFLERFLELTGGRCGRP